MTGKRSTTIPLAVTKPSARQLKVRRDRLLLVGTVLVVVAAWIIGYSASGADIAPLATEILPGATRVRQEGQLYIGLDGEGQIVGYAAAASAPGYSGPIEMLVAIDPAGQIQGVQVISQSESPGFFRLVTGSDLLENYSQKAFDDPLQLDEDLDAVSGATLSAEGVAAAVREAVRQIAEEGLGATLPPEKKPIQIGGPEIILVLLFAAGYVGHRWRNSAWKRRVRWATLISGMFLLGFLYTAPLTIAMIIALLSGYWPDWHNNLFWYLLIGGIIFVTTVEAKNPYCHWFCPFGAFQECLAAVTRAKPYYARDLTEPLKWLQRLLALTAIVLGLILRRPGVASYEPFATLFDFRGTTIAWIFLIVVLFASLLTYRPFCRYLCPLDPVVDFIATGRRWIKETWTQWRQPTVKS
jgi:NosR/NirI family transcriptional regulator, nitrous oxide reductase regulator